MSEAMKVFQQRELTSAVRHAEAGGQALHLHCVIANRARSPRCFVQAVDRRAEKSQINHDID